MRYGIYGGAFDPIHLGHLLLAEACRCQAGLDRVVFVPTGRSPHRAGKDDYRASPEDRFNMVETAIADCDEFLVSRVEIERDGPSYTVDTLRYFKETFTLVEPELFLLTGADMFNDIPNWRDPVEILRSALPLVVERPGSPAPYFEALASFVSAERLAVLRNLTIRMPQIELSSTAIRAAVAAGESIRFQVPHGVETYIRARRLYRI